MLGETSEKDLAQWTLDMKKQVLPVVQEMIIQKVSEIHHYMFGSMRSVGLVGQEWRDQFISRHEKLTLKNGPIN